jgi:CRP-like cAMP-binding protein
MDTKEVRKLKDKAANFIAKEKFKKAIKVYESILKLEPNEVTIMLKVGELLRRLGRNADAVAAYSQAAEYYAKDGMLLRAIAVCKVILDIDPQYSTTQELLAVLYTKQYGGPLHGHPKAEERANEIHAAILKNADAVRRTRMSIAVEIDLSQIREPCSKIEDQILIVDQDSMGDVEFSLSMPPPDKKLPEIPLFSDLDPASFVELLNRVPVRKCEAGERVVREGDDGNSFFIIISGAVQVTKGKDMPLAKLKAGAFFGEMAAVSSRPRQASVDTIDQCELIEIPKSEIDRLAKSYPHIYKALRKFTEQRLLHNLMLTSPLFTPFSKKERTALMRRFSPEKFSKGRTIIEQGQDGKGLYLIVSGAAEVVYQDENKHEHRITTLSEGDLFGEIALLTRSKATATVRAAQTAHLLCLSKEVFNEVIMTHPQILVLIAELSDLRKQGIKDVLKRDLASERDGGSAPL